MPLAHRPWSGKAKPVYSSKQIRAVEARAREDRDLMEAAGLAAAELARELLGANGMSVLVVAGPGNNGGDAFVVARHLRQWWYRVTTVAAPGGNLRGEAATAFQRYRDAGGDTVAGIPERASWDLVVDGLFGIGLTRDLEHPYVEQVARINHSGRPVLALDVPSGVDADTGVLRGDAVRADHTITFIALKPGLVTGDGVDHAGKIHVADLGLNPSVLIDPQGYLLERHLVDGFLPRRARNTHKGDYGNVGILGGTAGMVGAAILAGRAALECGAGRVYVGLLAMDHPGMDLARPELMFRAPEPLLKLEHLNCLVVGPGLGQSEAAADVVREALLAPLALVVDADALNLISAEPKLQRLLEQRSEPAILTPHPAEAARLLGSTTADVQANRVQAATDIASRTKSHIALKGAGSVCANPDGKWMINASGNPGLSSAGMGDVLSGLIGALLAQGLDPEKALLLGVHVHGAAADNLVEKGQGPVGLTASEVTETARALLNRWTYAT